MNQIEVFEDIDAPPDVVWDVLLEFDGYPAWPPFARAPALEDVPVEGDGLGIRIEALDPRGLPFESNVSTVERNRRLVRVGRLVVPFAFDGYHEFHLEPIDGGTRTRLLQRETVRGALVPLLFDRDRLERDFAATNEAIKERAEERVRVAA